MSLLKRIAAAGVLAACPLLAEAVSASVPNAPVPLLAVSCATGPPVAEPPAYYAIDLVPTRRVPGTGSARGTARLTFARSPFGVSLSPTGSYVYDVDVELSHLRYPRDGVLVVWVASADLAEAERLGVLDDTFRLKGQAKWNKFLVIVSLEPSATVLGDRWQGPIVARGMSRSGMMHTMAGHGAFEAEPCIKYGYR